MYPQPYAQPYAPTAPQEARTPKGVKWSTVAFAVYMVLLVVLLVLAVVAQQVTESIQPGASLDEILSALTILFVTALVYVAVGILVLVFYFLGFGYLYGGRSEYGPAHARNLRLALFLLIGAIAVGVGAFVVQLIISTMAIRVEFIGAPSIRFDPGIFYVGVVVDIGLSIVVAALVAALLVLSVRALARPKHQVFLYAAAGLGTATPGIVGALTLLQLQRLLSLLQDFYDQLATDPFAAGAPPTDPAAGIPTLVGSALGLVTFALFLYVYRDVRARIDSRELKPTVPPAAAPPPAWMPGPAVPQQPTPPPQQPPTPPPEGPGPQGPAP